VPWMQTQAVWYQQWFEDPTFRAAVVAQWNALQTNGVFTAWLNSIQAQASLLNQSQENNFARWPMLGEHVWPNAGSAGSYAGEVDYLTTWLATRIAYLDAELNGKAASSLVLSSATTTTTAGGQVSYTVQVTSQTGVAPTGSVTFYAYPPVLGTAQLSSGATAVFTATAPAPGNYNVTAVYSGDQNFSPSASLLTPLTVLPTASGVPANQK